MNTSSRFLQSLIFAAFSSSGLAQTTPPASEYEQGIILSAATLLPAELLKGPSRRVRDQVFTDGYMAHFTIDTDFGIYKAAETGKAVKLPLAKDPVLKAKKK